MTAPAPVRTSEEELLLLTKIYGDFCRRLREANSAEDKAWAAMCAVGIKGGNSLEAYEVASKCAVQLEKAVKNAEKVLLRAIREMKPKPSPWE